MAIVFFSYCHKDEALRDQLEAHLALLKNQGLVEAWHDRRIIAGSEVDDAISSQLEGADIILLLVSSDFIASSYCYSREMKRAMERHSAGEAHVIPVVLAEFGASALDRTGCGVRATVSLLRSAQWPSARVMLRQKISVHQAYLALEEA